MIGIIIPNWNGKEFLNTCLSSLKEQSFKDFKVFVIDNGSSDGSQIKAKELFPGISVMQLDKNYGLGKAINVGMEEALKIPEIKYLALLNNDIKADSKWLEKLIEATQMPENKNVGIFSPKILFMDTPDIIFSTGHTFSWGFLQERGFGKKDNGQFDKKLEIIGGSCASCLYKREMVEKIGLYKDELFFHQVDPEFSWRAKKQGWLAKFVPESIVYHKGNLYMLRKKDPEKEKESMIKDLKNLVFVVKLYGKIKNKFLLSFSLLKGIIIHWIKIHKIVPDWKIKINGKTIFNLWVNKENWNI